MSLADIFGDYDFSDYSDDYDYSTDYGFDDDLGGDSFSDFDFSSFNEMFADDPSLEQYGLAESGYDARRDVGGGSGFYALGDTDTTIAQDLKEGFFDLLGVGPETAKAISAFASAANRGGGKQAQAQGRGRVGPGLPTSARAPTSQAGRTSRARQATSGERAVQAAISQSNRAQSAARAIANQMARAGTITSTNDLADMISGATSPKGTKQALPGTRLRQLAIPRTA